MSQTLHATAVVLGLSHGPEGLLLTGASGAGKSALALALIDEWQTAGRFAALVADDRVALHAAHGRLLAALPEGAPAQLAGHIECRGLGIVARDFIATARIHRHIVLGAPPERMPEPAASTFEGVAIPRLDVPRLDGPHGAAALALVRNALPAHRPPGAGAPQQYA